MRFPILLALPAFAMAFSLTGFPGGRGYIPRTMDKRAVTAMTGCINPDGAAPCTDLPITSWGDCTNVNSTWDKTFSSVYVQNVTGIFCELFNDLHCGGDELDPTPGLNNLPTTWINQTSSYNCFVF